MFDRLDIDGFWGKVEKAGPDECWPYTGGRNEHGYGRHAVDGKQTGAHRIALFLAKGTAPSKRGFALHSCDNPPCCNPAHLRWGSAAENNQDRLERGRHHYAAATHCKRGHEFSGDNFILRNGRRHCRLCAAFRNGNEITDVVGRIGHVSGARTGSAKLSQGDIEFILASPLTSRKIGVLLGVSHNAILGVRQGRTYKNEIERARARVDDRLDYPRWDY